jgi:hypothetical protein
MRHATRAVRALARALGAIAAIVAPSTADAQDITTQAAWEIEAHVGVMGRALGSGTPRPLPAADGFTTINGMTSAAVSSWFFGDGAALFNRVHATEAIVPLDPALQQGITRRRGGVNLGFAAARWLSPRLAIEIQGDYAPSAVVMNDLTLAAIETTARSYIDAWSRLFDAGLAADGAPSEVVIEADADRGGGHQFVLTGGLKAVLHTRRRFRTYVAGAFGIAHNWNRAPGATLTATYQFAARVPVPGGTVRMPFAERDDIAMRAELFDTRTVVGAVHGGWEYYFRSRRGFRLDVAVLVSPNRVGTFLDATPSVIVQMPGAAIAGTTTPTIQFSSHPATVVRSSLSGPVVRHLETFRTEGLHAQIKLSLGYFLRF